VRLVLRSYENPGARVGVPGAQLRMSLLAATAPAAGLTVYANVDSKPKPAAPPQ